MAKPKSKALYEYLLYAGVLNSTPDEIALAKVAYRKAYLLNWKEKKAPLIKEIRIVCSLKEYKDVKVFSNNLGKSPTAFTKSLLLSFITQHSMLPNQQQLESIYQKIGLIINQSLKDKSNLNLIEKLITIEEELKEYLKSNSK
ncbi:MAG: hypothetical protein Q8M15_17045 [Bacteroidota bacterium]|nr:hypothetical protein [Bacteroidota bacterium]